VGNLLPLLLFASSFLAILSGQFGQPTILGFAVFTFGLALSARSGDQAVPAPPPAQPERRAAPRFHPVRGRSAYAEQLHGSAAQPAHVNGSVDR
jgi:hypothetical protein